MYIGRIFFTTPLQVTRGIQIKSVMKTVLESLNSPILIKSGLLQPVDMRHISAVHQLNKRQGESFYEKMKRQRFLGLQCSRCLILISLALITVFRFAFK